VLRVCSGVRPLFWHCSALGGTGKDFLGCRRGANHGHHRAVLGGKLGGWSARAGVGLSAGRRSGQARPVPAGVDISGDTVHAQAHASTLLDNQPGKAQEDGPEPQVTTRQPKLPIWCVSSTRSEPHGQPMPTWKRPVRRIGADCRGYGDG
jgi:hypothetical protein